MEFAEALAEAQACGFADADPASDGRKRCRLQTEYHGNLAFSALISMDDISLSGMMRSN